MYNITPLAAPLLHYEHVTVLRSLKKHPPRTPTSVHISQPSRVTPHGSKNRYEPAPALAPLRLRSKTRLHPILFPQIPPNLSTPHLHNTAYYTPPRPSPRPVPNPHNLVSVRPPQKTTDNPKYTTVPCTDTHSMHNMHMSRVYRSTHENCRPFSSRAHIVC